MKGEISSTPITSRYQFDSKIGSGGAGEVLCAWDKQLNRTVAIKRLKAQGIHEDVIQSAWQEAMRLAAIRHANIIAVYDMGMDVDTPCIVMEYVQGETLEQRSMKRPLNLDEFAALARQAMDGLVAAHSAGLIHRDLKPSNIMLSPQPSGTFQVKILDFGIAKFITTPTTQTMNFDGTITGSIYCIAPEQLNHEVVDARTDLYSIGCVFYYSLTGRYPFHGRTNAEVLSAHLAHRIIPLENYRPDLPAVLCQWVMALMNRNPNDRYQNALEAYQALDNILNAPVQHPAYAAVAQSTGSIRFPTAAPSPHTSNMPAYATVQTTRVTPSPVVLPGYPVPTPLPQNVTQPILLPQPPRSHWGPVIVASMIAMVITGGVGYFVFQMKPNQGAALPTPPPQQIIVQQVPMPAQNIPQTPVPEATAGATPATPTPATRVVFRMQGSNTVGAHLAPALMEEFFKREGATSIRRVAGASVEDVFVEAQMPNEKSPVSVAISAHGTGTAFEALSRGICEIGLASRPAKTSELESAMRAGIGDLRSPACEHVVGLDGIAIIVNQNNPVQALTLKEIAGIFTGTITDWSQVGGPAGPITSYARDDKSGTFDTFKSLVLGPGKLTDHTKRFEDSNELSDSVANDLKAIGFIGLPYIRNSKAIAVSEKGASALMPTRFTVGTEDYLLSRRLYLYTAQVTNHPWTKRFIEFALSDEGQEVVNRIGFVKQSLETETVPVPAGAPSAYAAAVQNAGRLNLNLRFLAGSTRLDNKGTRDLDRIGNLLATNGRGKQLLLFGFSDATGSADANIALSKERAQSVAEQLSMRGIRAAVVSGFGPAMPVASNETPEGREKNRRVEVWLR